MLCLLAKVDRQQFSVEGAVAGASEESGQIAVVVQEGLQVLMPMAGKACLLCLSWVLHVEFALPVICMLALPFLPSACHIAPKSTCAKPKRRGKARLVWQVLRIEIISLP